MRKAGELDDPEERRLTEEELEKVDVELEDLGDPVYPRLLADDATPEALAGLLATHERIAIIAAEAPIIDNLVGRYDASGSANLHLFCRAYTGEETRVDRRGREPEILERPLIATTLTVQHHVMQALIEHRIARHQGLVGRFAYVMPRSRLGSRVRGTPRVAEEVQGRWDEIVERVYSAQTLTEPTQGGSVGSVSDRQKRIWTLSLSHPARALLDGLAEAQEPRLAEDGDLRPAADWIARAAGRAARIAALLHLTEHAPERPISAETMRSALRINSYLTEHSLAALSAPNEQLRRAMVWLARRDETTVTLHDIHRGPLNGRGSSDAAGRLAHDLVEHGVLRPRDTTPPGRKGGRPPSPAFDINPNLRDPR